MTKRRDRHETNYRVEKKIAWEYVLPYKNIPILDSDRGEVYKLSKFLRDHFSDEALDKAWESIDEL